MLGQLFYLFSEVFTSLQLLFICINLKINDHLLRDDLSGTLKKKILVVGPLRLTYDQRGTIMYATNTVIYSIDRP